MKKRKSHVIINRKIKKLKKDRKGKRAWEVTTKEGFLVYLSPWP
jgi:hypothetical protein